MRPTDEPGVAAWVLHTQESLETVNVHLAALDAAGQLGIVEEHGRARVYFPAPVTGLPVTGRWEAVVEADWQATWREGLEPVTVGRVVVSPPWRARGDGAHDPAADIEVVIDPGQAFGTGHHETTTGCLAALQELALAGARTLDVGTGTGVLAIAAARLGAASVVAVDTDPLAIDAAAANAAANRVAIDVAVGSVDTVAGPFDVVVANLDTDTVCALAGMLVAALGPEGVLIVSGVSNERARQACDALVAAGVTVRTRHGRQWVVLVGSHAG